MKRGIAAEQGEELERETATLRDEACMREEEIGELVGSLTF